VRIYLTFKLVFDIRDGSRTVRAFYQIDVEIREPGFSPHLKLERLILPGRQSGYVFDTHPDRVPVGSDPLSYFCPSEKDWTWGAEKFPGFKYAANSFTVAYASDDTRLDGSHGE
jgi:hypothetical protein